MVLDGLAHHHENDVLADVRGVVGDPLEVPADEDEADGPVDGRRVLHHVGQELPEHLVVQGIHLVVPATDLAGQVLVAVDKGSSGRP